jgi:polysaccharide pyruvyl transferase CsaB
MSRPPADRPDAGRRLFLVGLYGVDNVGDDAIRLAVEQAARRHGADVHAFAVRRAVADPRAVRLRGDGWRRYLAAIRSADVVALGGGGLLKDEGHALVRGYGILLELLLTGLIARALGKRVVLAAIGAGPIHTRRGRWLVRAIAQRAAVRQVRDEDSAQTLHELGVEHVEVTVDPTFSFHDTPGPVATVADDGTSRHAVLSVRPWFMFERDREERDATLQAALARAADAIAQSGAEVRFASLYWPRDLDSSNAVIARMQAVGAGRALDGPLDWHALAAQLRGARLLISMRYHAIACAAIAGCPIVPVAYEPKVVSLARTLGLPHVHVDDPELEPHLLELTRSALADPARHTADAERLQALARTADQGLRRILS